MARKKVGWPHPNDGKTVWWFRSERGTTVMWVQAKTMLDACAKALEIDSSWVQPQFAHSPVTYLEK